MMTRFRYLNIITFCLIIAASGLVGCQGTTPIPETIPTTMPTSTTAIPTVEMVITHPELEAITPYNIDHLEQIDQWGRGRVHGIALAPDGGLIAVSTTSGIYLHDRNTIEQVGYIDNRIGNENDVEGQECPTSGNLAFSPDGSVLAISNTDITLWDLETSTIPKVIKNRIGDTDSIIMEIQFSADGSLIMGIQKRASGYPCYSGWGSLVIYAVETGELIFRHDHSRYEEGPDTIFLEKNGIAIISYLDTRNKRYSFLEVDLQTGDVVGENPSPAIYSMNNTAAVTYKWVSTGDNGEGYSQAHILDLNSFEDIEILNASVELIPRSDRVIVREQQKVTVRTLEGDVSCSKSIDAGAANAFLPELFSSDGTIALSWNHYGSRAGDVRIWDLEQCTVSEPVLIFPEVARQMSVSSDGRSVLTGSGAGYTFHVFDSQTGQMRFSLSGFDAQFSADGKQVFVVESEAVNAYDVETGEYLSPVLETDSDYMTTIVVSPNGKFLAINNNSVREYRIIVIDEDSSAEKSLASGNGYPHFSQDGNFMAEIEHGLRASQFRFWDLSTGKELPKWRGLVPSDGYVDASFNSDFTQLVTFGTDGYYKYAYIWDVPEFSLVNVLSQPFPNGDRSISNLKFTPDDRLLFARGSNPDVFLFWDVQTGNLLAEIPAEVHESELGNPIVFSPDGRLILALDSDGTIHVWGVK